MARILAIDYGKKRTGIAVTDSLQIIATALEVVESERLLNWLKAYLGKEAVEAIVIGMPRNLKNEDTEMTPLVREVSKRIAAAFPDKPIHFIDERFTTTIAHRSMIESGMKKSDRRVKGNADLVAATIILQDFLSFRK